MPKQAVIQVFEHGSIVWKAGRRHHHKDFKEEHYKAFEACFSASGRSPFFELIPYGVRFTSHVGAIHIGGLTIEVLPKADRDSQADSMQPVLLDMLKTCTLLTARHTGSAPLKLRAHSILELYFELFLLELESLVRRGLLKQYRRMEGQQASLKGALVFSRHLSANVVHRERFYTRHTGYDHDHVLLQILQEALLLISQLCQEPMLSDAIGRLRLAFPEVSRIKVQPAHFDRIPASRKTAPYRTALDIARLLLLNFRPDISAGRNDMLALMFDMNSLWEEFILRKLQRAARGRYKVSGQRSTRFWESKTIRPDIVVESLSEPGRQWVIDTKWKVIDARHPGDDDLRQIYAYNHHWNARHSLLLYPLTHGQMDAHGRYILPFKDQPHACTLAFVEVMKEGKLNAGIGEEVLGKLQHEGL